jgi:hypothetical protein
MEKHANPQCQTVLLDNPSNNINTTDVSVATLEKVASTCIANLHGTPYVIVSCAAKKKNVYVLEYTGVSKLDEDYEFVKDENNESGKDSLKVFII